MEEMECSEEFLELAHKMRAEQEEYRVWLMSQPPEIIIAHAAEWSARLSDEEDPEEIRLEIDAMAEGMARMMAAGC